MANEVTAPEPTSDPIDISIEAALELDELKENLRQDAPALSVLFELLRTPGPAFEGRPGVSMRCVRRTFQDCRPPISTLRVSTYCATRAKHMPRRSNALASRYITSAMSI